MITNTFGMYSNTIAITLHILQKYSIMIMNTLKNVIDYLRLWLRLHFAQAWI